MRARVTLLLIVILPVLMMGAGALYCWLTIHSHG
jgi:hypothetical protein